MYRTCWLKVIKYARNIDTFDFNEDAQMKANTSRAGCKLASM